MHYVRQIGASRGANSDHFAGQIELFVGENIAQREILFEQIEGSIASKISYSWWKKRNARGGK